MKSFTLEEAIEFAKTIPFDEIERRLSDNLGVKIELKIDEEVRSYSSGYNLGFRSQNVVDDCGVLAWAISDCYILSFGSWICVDEKTDKPYYAANLDFRYNLRSGGSNGMPFAKVFFDGSGLDIRHYN